MTSAPGLIFTRVSSRLTARGWYQWSRHSTTQVMLQECLSSFSPHRMAVCPAASRFVLIGMPGWFNATCRAYDLPLLVATDNINLFLDQLEG